MDNKLYSFTASTKFSDHCIA